jgi:predicted  nucleic acid-binding Zn-ribbon protein
MFCTNCGNKLPDNKDLHFCPNCGTKISNSQSDEQKEQDVTVVVGENFPSPSPTIKNTHSDEPKHHKNEYTKPPNTSKKKEVEHKETSNENNTSPQIGKSLMLQTVTNLLAAYNNGSPEFQGALGIVTVLNLIAGLIFNKTGGKAGNAVKFLSTVLTLINGGSLISGIMYIMEYPDMLAQVGINMTPVLAAFITSLKMVFVKRK